MQYRCLVEAAPDAIVVVNQSGMIVLVNAQAERLFGYRRDELIGQPAEILVPPSFRGQHSEQHCRFLAPTPERPLLAGLELFGLRKDGSEFPVEIRLTPLGHKARDMGLQCHPRYQRQEEYGRRSSQVRLDCCVL
jgi:PAS domain S-box-containing protein